MTTDAEPPLSLSVEPNDEEVVVVLAGELDPHTSPLLHTELQALTAAGITGRAVVLDLGGLTFIDSSGLRVLIAAHKELDAVGGRLVLANPGDTASRLLEITGLLDHLEVRS